METHFKERRAENEPLRMLYKRTDDLLTWKAGVVSALKHFITHKAMIGYGALFVASVAGAVWAILMLFLGDVRKHETSHQEEIQALRQSDYRQEGKLDALKDLIMTGQLRTAWPVTPSPPLETAPASASAREE